MCDRLEGEIGPDLWLKDLEAVVDSLRLEQFALLGVSQGGPTAIRHCRGDRAAPCEFGQALASGIAGARFVPMEGENHLFIENEPAHKMFFEEVPRFLGDKCKLVTRSGLARHARGFRAATHDLHHIIEPYSMIFFVASMVVGAVTFVLSRIL